METIKYSVIVPHYNSQQALEILLESIPDRHDVEIIVVDDNSHQPLNIQKQFKNAKLLTKVNDSGVKGAGAARNIALDIATGHWAVFADSDDYFTKQAFDSMDQETADDIDVVFFSPTSIYLHNNQLSNRHIEYEKLISDYLNNGDLSIRYKFYVPWSKVIKMSLIKESNIRFDEVIASNDLMFSLRVGVNLRTFSVSKSTVYCVTSGQGSLTKQFNSAVMTSRLLIELKRNEYCCEHGLKEYRNSVIFVLLKYKRVLNGAMIKRIFNMSLTRKLTVFPINLSNIIDTKLKKRALSN
ncbi:glycosyltransferase family A protein [Vibrio penaeicida]|uniref:Glycosyltransferase 2-like domain-containing protein n=1 Tax=Vibrio penaeicida TaxID=104609 RepID=A0AAV5NY45_9VIBR|nr:glycosyltransferase family A protein [Vibrio penaeicida]RTZ19331.1 glycosyltransferase family 2 protein [Vibrio penaeicida]GLQ75303.1 hypothetical protein GCM10007932_46650 [Vibrio penaeicida]